MAKAAAINPVKDTKALLPLLEARFQQHGHWHEGLSWDAVYKRLDKNPDKLAVLLRMEQTGGEPDLVRADKQSGALFFFDCAPESPLGRRSLCYDAAALAARKENKPSGNVLDMAAQIGIRLLAEAEYRFLQTLGSFDLKSSSWIETPAEIRKLGGALFCDRRYNTVFTYHNGADSYYAARGFRGSLRI